MIQKGRDFDDIFDLVAIRIVVDSVKDCYAALGCVHGQWKPVVGRFKDYVAMPKFNLYQSLHTTVIGPEGKIVEVQIRTHEMHRRAEWGVAAHWAYKEGSAADNMDWLNRMVDWQRETSDPTVFMEGLKSDLQQDEIFVFTPKGRVISLPRGSTPVDFAYAVHTEVGHFCIGSKVNGELKALSSQLQSGDTVEIFTSKVETAAPSRDWLNFVVSQRARSKIKQWFSRERREDMLETGRTELADELRRAKLSEKLPEEFLEREAIAAHYNDVESYVVAIGEHHVSAESVVQRYLREVQPDVEEPDVTSDIVRDPMRRGRSNVGVSVEGLDDVLVRLSKCCTPVPGDEIVGFITRGRGVSVHRADCANATELMSAQTARMVEVEWTGEHTGSIFRTVVEVGAFDRGRLLRDVANAIAEQRVNIVACSTHTGNDRIAKMRFEFELADPSHLDHIIRTILRIDNVYEAYRVVPGKGAP
ncbi:MAG: TGS domain-containing protein [Ilumatobacteraceae bacterium]